MGELQRLRIAARPTTLTQGSPWPLYTRTKRMRRFLLPALLAGLFALTGGVRADDKKPVVIMETNHGTIKIELNAEKAPGTVKNFLQYVDDKHFDGTIFHRVISTFMIQGGGFQPG